MEIVEDDLVSTHRARIKLTAAGWRNATVKKWNALPLYLRSEMSIGRFKTGLKRCIKERRDLLREPD